jgi:hypothetical protein
VVKLEAERPLRGLLWFIYLFFFHFSFIIHMCIQGLVHFSPLPPLLWFKRREKMEEEMW